MITIDEILVWPKENRARIRLSAPPRDGYLDLSFPAGEMMLAEAIVLGSSPISATSCPKLWSAVVSSYPEALDATADLAEDLRRLFKAAKDVANALPNSPRLTMGRAWQP